MIKISGFIDEASGKLDEQIVILKELRQEYMCPRTIDGKNITGISYKDFMKDIKPRLDANKIKFSSIGSGIGKIKLYDDEAYKGQLKNLEQLIKIAQAMECKYIRIFSFFVDEKGDYDSYFDEVVKKMQGFVKLAEGSGVVLLHENEKHIYADIPQRVLKLYDAINSPVFQLCYDASNYIQCNTDPFEAYKMVKDKTVYYHMKDCIDSREVPLGIGQGHIQEIINDLVSTNYDGFLTLEPHTGFYAALKIPFYICPLLSLSLPHSIKVYRFIDKTMGVKAVQRVSRKQIYLWQFNNLQEILKKAGNK
ncbi:MAG: sugar phosphate isomerase/epimerase [Clostridia bacterium]